MNNLINLKNKNIIINYIIIFLLINIKECLSRIKITGIKIINSLIYNQVIIQKKSFNIINTMKLIL